MTCTTFGVFQMGVPCVLYMPSAPGPRHTVTITEKSSWSVSVYIVASEVRSKKNKPKGEKGTRRKTYVAKKVGPATLDLLDRRRRP